MVRFSRVPVYGFLLAFALTASAYAQTPAAKTQPATQPAHAGHAVPGHVMVMPNAIQWGAAPPSLPAGAMMAVISGDPAGAGPYVIRAKLPDGYRIPPHWHPAVENVTVLSGTFRVGMGEKMDEAALKPLGAGGYVLMPAKAPHFASTKGETVIQVHGTGPFEVTYVQASDDPRNTKKTN